MSDHFNSANLPYPSATEISREFVLKYYTKWSFHLDDVYQFYGNDSVLSYDGHEASGQEDIQKTVNSLGYNNCKARIHSVNGLYGISDSLTLQVCGELSFNGGDPRKFLQSFVLCKQSTKKYYVQTDIFQWVDKAFCADFGVKKVVAAAATTPSESAPYAPPPPAAVEKPVVEALQPIKPAIDHMSYVEPLQPPIRQLTQQIAKDAGSMETVVKPQQQQQANGHDNADVTAAKQTTQQQQVNGYSKQEPARHSVSNVSGVGADANANVHHQPQAQQQQPPTKSQDNHPKSWAKAVSNNTPSGAPPPQQPPQPVYHNADNVNTNHDEEDTGAKKGHPRHYEKRNSGEFRGHYNNGSGNYRYQNRDGGPRDGYQNRDGGAPPFRGNRDSNRDNRDGGNRNSYGGERRYGGPGGGGGGNRNYAPSHGQQHQSGPPAGGNGGGRFGPSSSGNRHAGGQRPGGGGHRNYTPAHGPQQGQPQNVKVAQE